MIQATLHAWGGTIRMDPGTVILLRKLYAVPEEGDDPTAVHLRDGTRHVVVDSVGTLQARFGDAHPMSNFDDPVTGRWGAYRLAEVTALTKADPEAGGEDPTSVHLADGTVVSTGDSIRTLSARLGLWAGAAVVDLDVDGDPRPAVVVASHVTGVLRAADDEARSVVRLAGGSAFVCRDGHERLRESIARAREDACGKPSPDP